jgi:HlyD family secretion protein
VRWLRYLIVIGVVGALAGGYLVWARGKDAVDDGYVTAPVTRGPVVSAVTATGTVNPVTTVQVGTYVSGPILAIDVDYNSPVRKGQRVAKIDPAPFQVKVQSAQATLASARAKVVKSRADLALKQLTLERNQQLRTRNLIAQNDLDTAKSDYDQAAAQLALDEAAVQQAQSALDEARINLNYTDILSPVDGVVVSRSVDVGQTVAASFQTPTLFLIAQDLTKMQVDASVSESDIGAVRDHQHATFTVDAYPGREFQGVVKQVRNAPVTVQNVVTYDVVIGVENPELALKPGMTASVSIVTGEREDAVRVPLRALSFTPPQPPGPGAHAARSTAPAVWRVGPDGSLERVAIQTGIRDDQYAEVTSGDLQSGDDLAVGLRRGPAARPAVRIPGQPRFR